MNKNKLDAQQNMKSVIQRIATGPELSKNISRDEAISKLEEAKKLLDLEVISRKEYDSLKAVYTPYILKP